MTFDQGSDLATIVLLTATGLIALRELTEIRRQRRHASDLAELQILSDASEWLHRLLVVFLERPHLRPYFYDGQSPPADVREAAQIDTLSELFADCVDTALLAGSTVHSFARMHEDWLAYSRFLYASAPSLRTLIEEHGDWWPRLRDHFAMLARDEAALSSSDDTKLDLLPPQ